MRKTAYVDFDGTIVDVMPRYHGILEHFLKEKTPLRLEYDKYCLLKRQGLKDHIIVQQICGGFRIDIKEYVAFKRLNLEDKKWLKLDSVIGSPWKAYKQLAEMGFRVCFLSQRNYEKRLIDEIHSLQLEDAFDELIVVNTSPHCNMKAIVLRDRVYDNDIIIGDSPVEMECANMLGIKGFFVETGLWDKKFAHYNASVHEDYNSVVDFLMKCSEFQQKERLKWNSEI